MEKMVDFLMEDEVPRTFLTSMVACLFARGVYRPEVLSECLDVLGYKELSGNMAETSSYIRRLRWKTRFSTGFDPDSITIPKRFYKVRSWKGPVDPEYLKALKARYAERLKALVQES
jgi:aldehyde:ferredoxin oxidoreductase